MIKTTWPYKMNVYSNNTEKGTKIKIQRKETYGMTQNMTV
jgi:hypothetical protein